MATQNAPARVEPGRTRKGGSEHQRDARKTLALCLLQEDAGTLGVDGVLHVAVLDPGGNRDAIVVLHELANVITGGAAAQEDGRVGHALARRLDHLDALLGRLARHEEAVGKCLVHALPCRRVNGLGADGRAVHLVDVSKDRYGAAGALAQEELLVWGMMINFMKTGDRLDMMKKFVPHIDNWAVCDTFVPGAKWFSRVDGAWDILCGYFASGREFDVRFAVIMSMCHFMDLKWLPRIFYQFDGLDFPGIRSEYVSLKDAGRSGGPEAVLASGKGIAAGESPYYVRMGVAWCLATALAKFPDDTRAYLRHSRLPEDVLRLYARKARESFRTRDISPF